jgi:1-acyl-sn-glycerol-3-phosphate acyltransferase
MGEREAVHEASPPVETGGVSRPVLAQGPYVRLLLGSLSGTLGDRLYQIAVIAAVGLVFKQASSQLSYITGAGVIAQFFLYPFIGSFVDSLDRRRLLWGICAVKVLCVLAFVPYLLNVGAPEFKESWTHLLALIFVLSLITVPFGPARASAIPDTVTADRIGIAASLMACTNLFSILVGSLLGSELSVRLGPWLGYAKELKRGPMLVIPIAAALFLLAAVLLRGLPNAVAVPGNRRAGPSPPPGAAREGWLARAREYACGTWEGLAYSVRTRGVVALYLFEAAFWFSGVCFYVLFEWHTPRMLYLTDDDKVLQFGYTLGCAGLGLFVGALAVGKLCRFVSPLFTYPVAFLLMGGAMWAVFGTHGTHVPADKTLLDIAPEHWEPIHAANVAVARGLLPYDFLLGLGGGFLLGRVDADMLALTDERIRGRVFALKGFFFTGALLIPLAFFATKTDFDQCAGVAYLLPRALLWAALPVVALSWFLDCGLHAEKCEIRPPGFTERLAYAAGRTGCWLISKAYFRLSVVGGEKVPRAGPVILVANHGSFFDPFWLGMATRRIVRYIMHRSYYRGALHPMYRHFCTIPVEEGQTLLALKAGVQILAQGGVTGMFPEGHVSEDGKLQQPKSGAMFLAQRSGATVVPVAIKGNTAAFPRWRKFPRPGRITLIIGESFTMPKDAGREQVAAYTDRVMAELAKLLEVQPPPKCEAERRRERKNGENAAPADTRPPA